MQVSGIVRALSVGALIAAVAFVPVTPAFAQAKEKVSNKLAKPLHAAQEAMKEKKFGEAVAKLKEADALPGKTPYDQHVINQFLAYSYVHQQNYAEAVKPAEALLEDGLTPASDIGPMTREVVGLNYQLKNYDKVVEYGNRAIKGGFADEQIRTMVGQAYYLKGDWKGTEKFEEGLVDSQIKAGETPKNDTLMLVYSACQKMNDEACSTRALEKLVTYYPKKDNWTQLLYGVRKQASNNETDLRQTYLLMFEVDVLKEPTDYSEMAELALDAGSPGEAARVLERALSLNVFTDPRTKARSERLLASSKKRAASDQAQLPKLEQEADAATRGDKNAAVGRAYFGYEQYGKAVEQLAKGLTKGVSKDEPEMRLMLGIAQLKSGHKDEAVKTFHAVKGDATLERLANLWVLHSKQA